MLNSIAKTAKPHGFPHILFFPSPGMGHLVHFLRLASLLSSRNCTITFVNPKPTRCLHDSALLSAFFSSHPDIVPLELHTITSTGDTSTATIHDAFIDQFRAINRSVHLLPSLLLSSLPQPPLSAVFSDFVVAASLTKIKHKLGVPIYIVSTTSARCYSTVACLPGLLSSKQRSFDDNNDNLCIPGLSQLPKSLVPPSWLVKSSTNQLLNEYLIPNSQSLSSLDGVLLNSFNFFEQETIGALLEGRVLSFLPPLYPVGPFESYKTDLDHGVSWLDDQITPQSVVYVNFGTRLVMSVEQTRELGKGLAESGFPFLWVLNRKEDSLGRELLESTKKKKGFFLIREGEVNQASILAHRAIGGFVNQCEWASVTEAAWEGVPMLAWPQHGDHKMNAEVVEKAGLGIWGKDWGWGGERLVRGEEVEEKVKELMGDENLRAKAMKVGEEARKACQVGGSSETALMEVIQKLKLRDGNNLIS